MQCPQVTHLMRCSGTVQLAAAACSMDVLRVWGRYILCLLLLVYCNCLAGTCLSHELFCSQLRLQQVIVFYLVCRWARSEGVVGKSYLPKSPLSALPATGILAGFGANFMSNHAFG